MGQRCSHSYANFCRSGEEVETDTEEDQDAIPGSLEFW